MRAHAAASHGTGMNLIAGAAPAVNDELAMAWLLSPSDPPAPRPSWKATRFTETVKAFHRWTFGPAVLDERTRELIVDGVAVAIERKPLEVLRFLLDRGGAVASKDEILEAVWPGRILSETVLTKCIARLREVLRDADHRVIKTHHGFGYRLVTEVMAG